MEDNTLTQLRQRVSEFESIIRRAKEAQHSDVPPEVAKHFLDHDPVLIWDIQAFITALVTGKQYPEERLERAVDRLIDTKLQFYFVSHTLPATQNLMVYLRGFDPNDPLATPGLQLARLCYSQSMIGQSRILWERLMRFIYFLEQGKDPEGKSVRRKFFATLPTWSPRWDVLSEWEGEIDTYDSRYRTPEYHKGSILKRELLGGSQVDPNEILGLMTPIMNGLWPVLLANVKGKPHNITRLGRNVTSTGKS